MQWRCDMKELFSIWIMSIYFHCLGIKLAWTHKERRDRSNLLASCAFVLHRTSDLVILRRCFLGDVKEMYQNKKSHVQCV